MVKLSTFNKSQMAIINDSTAMAEELVCNHYKMSASQWFRSRYDIKTLADLGDNEIVDGHFAQIVRYEGKRRDASLGSSAFDFYKICIQDHSIIETLNTFENLGLFPFSLYIITHELIHIVRFSKFQQNFDASVEEKIIEESRVHEKTHRILNGLTLTGLRDVLGFYKKWRNPID